jgi:hypothetical protein
MAGGDEMHKLTLIFLIAAGVGTAGAAAAQQPYWGPGAEYGEPGPRTYDEEPYYHRRYYDDGRYYRRRYEQRRYRTWNGCPPHYTVQDGVCKPYRGY